MANQVTVKITDYPTPALAQLRQVLQGNMKPYLLVLGRTGQQNTKAHYFEVNGRTSNKLGGTRTNFWNKVADTVSTQPPGTDSIKIGIAHPAIGQKVYGGEIRAKRHKHLAIPLTAEAYNHPSPRLNFWSGKLFPLFANGKLMLAEKGPNGSIQPQFWLPVSVRQKPDPDALPPRGPMQNALSRASESFINRKLREVSASKEVTA